MNDPLLIQDYSADLHALAAMVSNRQTLDEVLERALESLQGVIPYDLAAVFRLEKDVLQLVAAAGPLASPTVRRHRLELKKFPTLRNALDHRQPLALKEHHHAGDEGDPYDGILDLPDGHSCMVVPLWAGERALGLITLDRTVCQKYDNSVVRIAAVYGHLISLAMLFGEQASLLNRYRHQLKEQNRLLQEDVGPTESACQFLEASASPAMRLISRQAKQVAASELPVLILGETGTGKEVLARAIHAWSPRADGPFIKLNCAAIPEQLVESELFGHVKGAFSGADRERQGRFLTANGGTLLLDEIGDMPLAAQSKLLRVLQERMFEPVGSDKSIKVDVRVLAATHVNLEEAIRAGRFREDLYYRLAVFPVRLPALRERPEELGSIAERFLEGEARRTRRGPWRISSRALAALEASSWPGNIRQLINVLERATILRPEGVLEPEDLGMEPPVWGGAPRVGGSVVQSVVVRRAGESQVQAAAIIPALPESSVLMPTFEENERHYFEEVLRQTGGRLYGLEGAAEVTGLKPTTLRSRLVKLGLR